MENDRARDAQQRIHRAEAARRFEAEKAQELIDQFLKDIADRRIPAEPLAAKTLSGHVVKTDKMGWYLRQDKSVAIGTDGGYYSLIIPGSFWTRFKTVSLTPVPPPLRVGNGGRDGETGELSEFLAWRLEAG